MGQPHITRSMCMRGLASRRSAVETVHQSSSQRYRNRTRAKNRRQFEMKASNIAVCLDGNTAIDPSFANQLLDRLKGDKATKGKYPATVADPGE